VLLGAAAIFFVGLAQVVRTYRRSPVDTVWPPRLDAEIQERLPNLPDPVLEPSTISLIDLPSRPGVFVREGEVEGLRYLEVVFGEDVDPDSPLPLLVALHGRGDRPRVPGAPFDRLGRPVRVVLPAAPDRYGDGFAWSPFYVRQGRTPELAVSIRAAGVRVAAFLRAFMSERPTIGLPLVSGFSQGGMLTWVLAIDHSELVEAAFPLSTWFPPPLWPVARPSRVYPSIRTLHGEDDPTIPVGLSLTAVEGMRDLGIPVELEVFPGVEHYLSREMARRHEQWIREALDAMLLRFAPPPTALDGGADGGPDGSSSASSAAAAADAGST
jgi:phospholipase/carboxylesterase